METGPKSLLAKTWFGRGFWLVVGLTFFALGVIGYIVPGVPGTIFLILSLFSFKRGNERFEKYLLNHRLFGPPLRQWEADKSMTIRAKVIAISMMWISVGFSARHFELWAEILLALLAVAGTAYIISVRVRPTSTSSGDATPQESR